MNINNPSPYTSYESYYQASGNDYGLEENEDLNVEQPDVQTHTVQDYKEYTYPDDGTDQIYRKSVEYGEFRQNPCVSCSQVPYRKFVTHNQNYYPEHYQAPRMRLAKVRKYPRSPTMLTYRTPHQCQLASSPPADIEPVRHHQQNLAPAVIDVKKELEFRGSNQNYQQNGDYGASYQTYHGGAYEGIENQRNYSRQDRHSKMGHCVTKKYPVTLKMPRYCMKKSTPPTVNKKPSTLSLPLTTQIDPSTLMVERKHRQKIQRPRKPEPTELIDPYSSFDENQNFEPIATHQITSHGDVIDAGLPEVENVLDQMKNDQFLDEEILLEEPTGDVRKTVREYAKFLKPKVPSSIKTKQDQVNKMASDLNIDAIPAFPSSNPKKKISLEQLLTRLQKCETDSVGKSGNNSIKKEHSPDRNKTHQILNYETISRKIAPEKKPKTRENAPRASTSLTTSLDRKKSLDDYGAFELHKSKSYIVNLIDRALSKELGTIPRERLSADDMSTKKALESISRHRGSLHKELCYEVTAALTDSFISNATAPPLKDPDEAEQDETRSEDSAKNKICTCNLDDSYVRQLRQLRWGHIRHIQHEARRLADLEEFLDKIGESDF